jgi:phosphohistidine phosphatase
VKVWILRHGEAQPQAARDAERRLTAHGQAQAVRAATHLAGQPLQAIIASPYVRAQQTAALVHQALATSVSVRTGAWLTPDGDPREVLDQLDALALEHVLLVSHQPLVGELVSLLEQGHVQQPVGFSTASLAELEGAWALAGGMTLRALHQPD